MTIGVESTRATPAGVGGGRAVRAVAGLVLVLAATANVRGAHGAMQFLYGRNVSAASNWSNPEWAEYRVQDSECPDSGPPDARCYCHCGGTDACSGSRARHALEVDEAATPTRLEASNFRLPGTGAPFVLPADHRITHVRVNVLARYDKAGTARGRQVRLRIAIPGRSDVVLDSDEDAWPASSQGSDGYFCNWRRWGGGDLDLGALSEAEINALRVSVHAIDDGPGSEELRVKAFRLRVEYEPDQRCGNGRIESPEQCDGGPCCASCQLLPPGSACGDDGNLCTSDVCNAAGVCAHPANTASCDDGLFCNGADACRDGTCSQHDGDPCTGSQCTACDEGTNRCEAATGPSCGCDDGNPCTTDSGDGTGHCTHVPNSAPCDDGLFCNGADHCSGGTCSVHDGAGCIGIDECNVGCDEATDQCAPARPGTPCASDGDECTRDACDGAGECTHTPTCPSQCDPPSSDGPNGPGPNSVPLPPTNEPLTIELTSPAPRSVFGFEDVPLEGRCTTGDDPHVNLVYVIDVSGSTDLTCMGTLAPFVEAIDVDDDGDVDAADDVNRDGQSGEILDAEIYAFERLNASLGNGPNVRVGVVGFAGQAFALDVQPQSGSQLFVSPPEHNVGGPGDDPDLPDLVEVLRGLRSNCPTPADRDGEAFEFTPLRFAAGTDYASALRAARDTLRALDGGTGRVIFLSDGANQGGVCGPGVAGMECEDAISGLVADGVEVHTVAIGRFDAKEQLQYIANRTHGEFVLSDPTTLVPDLLSIAPGRLDHVLVDGERVTPDAAGGFATSVPCDEAGTKLITAECVGSDPAHTRVAADVTVTCGCEMPEECEPGTCENPDPCADGQCPGDPCAEVAGDEIGGVRCVLATALSRGFCTGDELPKRLEKTVTRGLGRADTFLGRAESATESKQRRSLRRAVRSLDVVTAKTTRAVSRETLTPNCGEEILGTVQGAADTIGGLVR